MSPYKITKGSSVLLDLIRGISAQAVVLGHGISFFGICTVLQPPHFPYIQNIAVLVFFLLSGFLITYSLVQNQTKNPNYAFAHYFIDRFSRIYAAFIPALLFIGLLDALSLYLGGESYVYSGAFNIKTFLGNVFMLQDFPLLKVLGSNWMTSFGSARPFWTLAVEWWIYMFFGFLILHFLKVRKNNLIFSFFVIGILCIVPIYNLVGGRGNGLFVYWLFGALVYLVSRLQLLKNMERRFIILFLIVAILCGGLRIAIKIDEYEPIFAFILAIILFLGIELCASYTFSDTFIRIINYNASFSFTLYLIHYSIIDFIATHFKNEYNPYLLFIFSFVCANVVSILIGRYTEMVLTQKVKAYLYAKIRKETTIS